MFELQLIEENVFFVSYIALAICFLIFMYLSNKAIKLRNAYIEKYQKLCADMIWNMELYLEKVKWLEKEKKEKSDIINIMNKDLVKNKKTIKEKNKKIDAMRKNIEYKEKQILKLKNK